MESRSTLISAQDIAAALVSLILTIGVVYLSTAEIEIPSTLTAALMACIGWLFGRSADVAATKRKANGNPPVEEPPTP
jgi:uncharacterized membrane protein AbrB (regulator of aidB expression)